jgi:hypothetical protein
MTAGDVDAYLAGLGSRSGAHWRLYADRSWPSSLTRRMHLLRDASLPSRGEGGRWASPPSGTILPICPPSGRVLPGLGDALTGYEGTQGSLHFPIDEPLPDDLAQGLVDAKLKVFRRSSQAAVVSARLPNGTCGSRLDPRTLRPHPAA